MTIFDVLNLLCGLALFLFGMNLMGTSLKKSVGNKLKNVLGEMTSNPFKGFGLGLIVTALVQSSSTTSVMVVGFVNSGTMALMDAIYVISGANLGATVTPWIMSLSSIGTVNGVTSTLEWFKVSSWLPIVAIIGAALLMFGKTNKKKDIAMIIMGFTVIMIGMEYMSGSMADLANDSTFHEIFTTFNNPLLGLLIGILFTVIVQSSSASIGVLQTLTTSGVITYNIAFPIIIGQNIGTCITALLSSIGATKDARRAALIHLYYNLIGGTITLVLYFIMTSIFDISILSKVANMWDIALINTLYKLFCAIILWPLSKFIVKIAEKSVPEKKEKEEIQLLDERFLSTPSVAVQSCRRASQKMAYLAFEGMKRAVGLFLEYDPKVSQQVREMEQKVDDYEDALGTYLVKLSSADMTQYDAETVTELLRLIGDFERISDHSVNLVESFEEIHDNKIVFSDQANNELSIMFGAVMEIMRISQNAFITENTDLAFEIEPLEQVVDYLKDEIKRRHIERLQNNECTIEHGFVLNDLLTNLERVSDHCSNIGACIIEISKYDALGMHVYLHEIKEDDPKFKELYNNYLNRYKLD